MAISEQVTDRLWNWKFESARKCMTEEQRAQPGLYTNDEYVTITRLAQVFENCGWQDGFMADIIRAATAWLLQQPLDVPEDWLPPQLRGGDAAEM